MILDFPLLFVILEPHHILDKVIVMNYHYFSEVVYIIQL